MIKVMKYLCFLFPLFLFSCSDEVLNEIDKDPNNPLDVRIKQLMPTVTSAVPYYLYGTDLAWYSAVFSESATGTYQQMWDAEKRSGINSYLSENIWTFVYADILNDLNIIIRKGSYGGVEEGNYHYVGMAKVLMALTYSVATDTWGDIPFSDALAGIDDRKPGYDKQQNIYDSLQVILSEAIKDFDKVNTQTVGDEDQIYGGDTDKWKKAAWALKARYYLRVSKKN